MSRSPDYTAEALPGPDALEDVRVRLGNKTWHLWGRNGEAHEARLADNVPDAALPVLLGAGLGHCLRRLRKRGLPVAVVDREKPMDRATNLRARWEDDPGVLWLDRGTPDQVMARLSDWRAQNHGRTLTPVPLPLYLRLDREFYGFLAGELKGAADFWSRARYPKFRSVRPRVLFFDSDYFLCREILGALEQLEVPCRVLPLGDRETGSGRFIESLLEAVVDFKPDFILTVNHFGLDREGKLSGLLEELGLPLASWFVDNPHLILHEYAHPGTDNTVLFSFDAGNLDMLRAKGFPHVHYLPLATDPGRFRPGAGNDAPASWGGDVSFVGNSMAAPVADALKAASLPPGLKPDYQAVARDFGTSGVPEAIRFVERSHPAWFAAHRDLPTTENRLALESLLTWEATRQYRLDCVGRTLEFAPLIVGDAGWKDQLHADAPWRHLDRLDYYADLPRFYPQSRISFNCTSRQMVGAVNQRVFDVPACGGFVLTDYREQMEALFDLDREAVVYRTPGEIPDLIRALLKDEARRKSVTNAARKRILSEHTYAVRLARLLETVRSTFPAS
jgi:spore maturation protein CgeB